MKYRTAKTVIADHIEHREKRIRELKNDVEELLDSIVAKRRKIKECEAEMYELEQAKSQLHS